MTPSQLTDAELSEAFAVECAKALEAEFVIFLRAGCTQASQEYLADFLARETRRALRGLLAKRAQKGGAR